jgi:hypothetical protein
MGNTDPKPTPDAPMIDIVDWFYDDVRSRTPGWSTEECMEQAEMMAARYAR